jgi:D-alanyl-D-alanine carboxypeptidase
MTKEYLLLINVKRIFITVILYAALFLFQSCSKSGSNNTPSPPPPPAPPPPPSVVTQKDVPDLDNAVSAFMNSYSIPGVSIAIVKNEKLIYVKSYGKMSALDNTSITNNSLFRIASVSKTITAVGIMKLLEANKLTMDSKVFGDGSILGNDYPSPNLTGMSDITVRHLLTHTAGAWPTDGTDPMFKQPSYTHSQLIKWTLDNYPAPASGRGVYTYSNFGYSLLGRIIEKLSGKTYEQYIKEAVLTPSGITAMQIAGNTVAERKTNEVLYTGQGGFDPYSYNITRTDAHGGWIASATDLARFIIKVDGFTNKPDILQSSTITTMTTRPAGSNYASGWVINNSAWWHSGGLPGTASLIVRANNGFSWVILANSRSYVNNFATALDQLIWPFVNNANTPWQDIDQF